MLHLNFDEFLFVIGRYRDRAFAFGRYFLQSIYFLAMAAASLGCEEAQNIACSGVARAEP